MGLPSVRNYARCYDLAAQTSLTRVSFALVRTWSRLIATAPARSEDATKPAEAAGRATRYVRRSKGPAQSLWRSSVQAAQLTALGLRAFVHPRRTCLSSSRDCQLGARPSGWVASAVVKQPTQFPKPPTVTPNFARRFDVASIVDSGCGFG
jgi:hypothetical protein